MKVDFVDTTKSYEGCVIGSYALVVRLDWEEAEAISPTRGTQENVNVSDCEVKILGGAFRVKISRGRGIAFDEQARQILISIPDDLIEGLFRGGIRYIGTYTGNGFGELPFSIYAKV